MESFAGFAKADRPDKAAGFDRLDRSGKSDKAAELHGLMDHPRKMKHFAGHKRKDELWQQSFHPRQGLRP